MSLSKAPRPYIIITLCLLPPLLWVLAKPGQGAWEEEQVMRQARLARVCEANPRAVRKDVDPDRFLYDASTNTLWCDVAKAGSTTYIRTIFFPLAEAAGLDIYTRFDGRTPEIDRSKVQKHFQVSSRRHLGQILEKQPLVFAVARHPFHRLVSAFLDFRTRKSTTMAKGSFTNFLRASVLKDIRSCTGGGCAGLNNHHWRPLDSCCSFCVLNYTVLSTMETFGQDYARISARFGVKGKVEARRVRGGGRIGELTRQLFATVPQEVKDRLKILYKMDLQMFGYEANI